MPSSPASALASLIRRRVAAGCLVSLLIIAAGCGSPKEQASGQKPAGGPPPVPVAVGQVGKQNVPVVVKNFGNVEPLSTVQVKAMIAGQLQKVHFKEGDRVQKGQLLFTIDPRPFEAVLKQAEAALERDKAQLANAQLELRRAEQMVREGIVERQQLDQRKTAAESLVATVGSDNAAIERAKVDLSYTVIRAPIDGRTGSLMVDEGSLVKANDVPLVTINQLTPIYVNFTVPEKFVADVRQFMSQGKLAVAAAAPGDTEPPSVGELVFVNNQVERGSIQLKALFPNDKDRLWPGQYVQTTLTLSTRNDAVVVPSQAIQTGQKGQYVYVLKADQTVENRSVEVSDSVDGHMVVEKGLQPGETVVTDGQLKLAPGAKVAVRDAAPADGTKAS